MPVAIQGRHQEDGVVLRPAHFAHPKVLEVVAFACLGRQRELQAIPRVSSVRADVDQPIVATRGQHAKLCGVLRECGQGPKGHVSRKPASCEIAASRLKRVSAVERAVHLVGGHVEHVLLVFAEDNGGLPIPPERRVSQRMGGVQGGALPCRAIGAHVPPKLVACVHHLVAAVVHFNLHAVAPT